MPANDVPRNQTEVSRTSGHSWSMLKKKNAATIDSNPKRTNVVTGSCSESGPIAEPWGSEISGGFRETPVGSFLVSDDGQKIMKTWNPTPELTQELDLDAAPIF